MGIKDKKEIARLKRHRRVRKKICGTKKRPRVSVYKSHTNLYVQFVDDIKGETLTSFSTRDKKLKQTFSYGGNIQAAALLGEMLAKKAKAKGFKEILFDRGGYPYHGRIKALAESARKHGLEF